MKIRSALTMSAAALALSAGTAHAEGPYFFALGGLTTQDEDASFDKSGTYSFSRTFYGYGTTLQNSSLGFGAHWSDDFENGFFLGFGAGFELPGGFRGELEGAYRSNDVDGGGNAKVTYTQMFSTTIFPYYGTTYPDGTGTTDVSPPTPDVHGRTRLATTTGAYGTIFRTSQVSGTATVPFQSSGEVNVWSFMANLWYDFDFGDSPIQPFVGGGIGVAKIETEYRSQGTATFGTYQLPITYSESDDTTSLSYQFGAGIRVPVSEYVSLSGQYRYFGTTDGELGGHGFDVAGHSFLLGLSVGFGALQ